jgi:hypothetical protein
MAFSKLCSGLLTRGWIGREFDGGLGHVHFWVDSTGVSGRVGFQILIWGVRDFREDSHGGLCDPCLSIRFNSCCLPVRLMNVIFQLIPFLELASASHAAVETHSLHPISQNKSNYLQTHLHLHPPDESFAESRDEIMPRYSLLCLTPVSILSQ